MSYRSTVLLIFVAAALACGRDAFAQIQRNVGELEEVGVTEKLNNALPLDASFVDDSGRSVKLWDYFDGERPVILSLNYSNCPMLCGLQLNGLIDSLEEIDLEPGVDFDVLSVSIDPLETPIRARQAKQRFLREYGRAGAGGGWNFLVGQQTEITSVAEAVGFRYQFVPERNEYAHAAVFMICTPDGRISRYIYGVEFPPRTVRLSLVEAAEGKIGNSFDQVLLFCFQYDAKAGSYAPTAIGLMKVGGLLTVVVLAACLIPVWRRAKTAEGKPAESNESTSAGDSP